MAVAGYEYRVDGDTPVDVGNVLTANVTGLTAETEYDFEVRSYDAAGNRSPWSVVVSGTTFAPFPTANLILDVEPDAFGLTEGDSIVTLDNSIVGQNDGTQGTGANRATYHANVQNGKGSAQFDGTNDSYNFGNIFDSLTQGSMYLLVKKTVEQTTGGGLKDGHWQTEVSSGSQILLGYDQGAYRLIAERLFGNAARYSNPIAEPFTSFFLYEVHASGSDWEAIMNTSTVISSNANTFTANAGFLFGTSWGCFLEGSILRILGYSAVHNEVTRETVREHIAAAYDVDILDHLTTNIVFVGDSITYSYPFGPASGPDASGYTYPNQTLVELGGGNYWQSAGGVPMDPGSLRGAYDRRLEYFGRNRGVGGYTTTDLESEAAATDAFLNDPVAANNILCVMIGTNDFPLLSSTPATVHAAIESYCQDRQAAGWTVYVGTILRRSDVGSVGTTNADSLNTLIRANYTNYADGLMDFAADARFADPDDTTYIADQVHPTQLGYQIMGEIAAAALAP